MKKIPVLLLALILLSGIAGFVISGRNSEGPIPARTAKIEETGNPGDCIPAFRDGGGPYYKPGSPFRTKIVPDINNGERLIVEGRILGNDCKTPVAGAVLDIWQANESGNYEDAWYRGQVNSGANGGFSFESVVPKGYGEGTGYRPPHIHFKVIREGREIITSQMFFPEVKGTPGFDDAYIMKVVKAVENGITVHKGTHDIILP